MALVFGSLAQLAEQTPLKRKVLGPIPRRSTINSSIFDGGIFLLPENRTEKKGGAGGGITIRFFFVI